MGDRRPSVMPVSSRLVNWLAVLSLIIVLGGHWMVLQSIAWVTMLAGYSQAMPLRQAVVNTFDGQHPCPICQFVAQGKQTEQKQQSQRLLSKLDLFLAAAPAPLCPPARDAAHFAAPRSARARSEVPPPPPPRSLPG